MRLNRLLYQTYSSTYTINDYSLNKTPTLKSPSAFQKGLASGETAYAIKNAYEITADIKSQVPPSP